MKKIIEEESGATIYSNLFTFNHLDWNVLIREGGTVAIYGTQSGGTSHSVAVDDCVPMILTRDVDKLEAYFQLMVEAANVALAAIQHVREAKESEAANG